MPLFHIVILALVQGITEFLPVSSSGHLVLAHSLLGSDGKATDLMMDVAVHVGTLFAVLLYFRADIIRLLHGACGVVCRRDVSGTDSKMLLALIVASLPVVICGYLIHVTGPDLLRSVPLMAACSIIFGAVLWFADKKPGTRKLEEVTMRDALVAGLAQALALIPGVSRSGVTMTAARYLGFSRTEAARFSLLLAIVAISGAGVLEGAALLKAGDVALGFDAAIAALLSFFSSLAALVLMMRWLAHATFTPFVIYRVLFGAGLLALYFLGYL